MTETRLRNYMMVIILIAAALWGGRSAWEQTIKIGCLPVGGHTPAGIWMDGCASDQMGNLSEDVLWFNLHPVTVQAIQRAKVLLFGDSRMLTAASAGGASDWFSRHGIPMYLLAFAAGEQSGWADRLVSRLHPHPDMVVFDADPYFTGEESIPAQAISDDPAGEEQSARDAEAFLANGPQWCRWLGFLCARTQHFYRQDKDGIVVRRDENRVWFNKNQEGDFPIEQPGPGDTSSYGAYLDNARKLISKLDVKPECVVFTIVPNNEMDDTLARYLAKNLGARVVAPKVAGLSTVDHYHLTRASAREWSERFFEALAPVVNECVGPASQAKS